MPFSISPISTQAQLLDSNSLLPPDGEQIFVKSCQFALPFLTQIFHVKRETARTKSACWDVAFLGMSFVWIRWGYYIRR